MTARSETEPLAAPARSRSEPLAVTARSETDGTSGAAAGADDTDGAAAGIDGADNATAEPSAFCSGGAAHGEPCGSSAFQRAYSSAPRRGTRKTPATGSVHASSRNQPTKRYPSRGGSGYRSSRQSPGWRSLTVVPSPKCRIRRNEQARMRKYAAIAAAPSPAASAAVSRHGNAISASRMQTRISS